jgi:hypothetical protein
MKSQFFIEMTDTYGGEANYSWVNRFLVTASSEFGAIRKVTRRTGYPARSVGNGRYNVPRCAICYFVEWVDAETTKTMIDNYSRIEVF